MNTQIIVKRKFVDEADSRLHSLQMRSSNRIEGLKKDCEIISNVLECMLGADAKEAVLSADFVLRILECSHIDMYHHDDLKERLEKIYK